MRAQFIILLACILISPLSIQGEDEAPVEGPTGWATHPLLRGSEAHTYKNASGVDLKLYVFSPPDHQPTDSRAAIVFFFGGAWTTGTPTQFAEQARYLASRGMVAACADYRLRSRHGVTPIECVADAKSAIRWMRANAAKLGIDPDRIAAGGGSAGGHIAACAGVVEGFDDVGEDLDVSSVPNAMVLFNPALDVMSLAPEIGFGADAEELSPALRVRNGSPPTIIFHGRDDRMVPFEQAERFTLAMKNAGNRCELIAFDGEGHGFFNHVNPAAAPRDHPFHATLLGTDAFLVSLGWLELN